MAFLFSRPNSLIYHLPRLTLKRLLLLNSSHGQSRTTNAHKKIKNDRDFLGLMLKLAKVMGLMFKLAKVIGEWFKE
jgi:hypothetical protein